MLKPTGIIITTRAAAAAELARNEETTAKLEQKTKTN
jgi:hypothetical protein